MNGIPILEADPTVGGGFKVLNHLNFAINRDETRFLIGPNGAGKTTLLDIITGKTKAANGKVMLDRSNITRWSEHRRVHLGIARKFQTPSIFSSLTVYETRHVFWTVTTSKHQGIQKTKFEIWMVGCKA
jgi:ABC-type uncharacterized transport system ATPase subunit